MMTATIHPFEKSGLGLAPFRFAGMTENVYAPPGCPPKAGGTCDYCSNGIRYEFWIVSSDGNRFKVGSDCVAKLDRADNRLLSAVKRAKAQFEAKKREEKREAARIERNRLYEIELEAQRVRNGGLTDHEVAKAAEEAELAAKTNRFNAENAWLIDVLNSVSYRSEFNESMIAALGRSTASELSPKCLNILEDIYSKSHGRRGSKAYVAATKEFQRRAGITD